MKAENAVRSADDFTELTLTFCLGKEGQAESVEIMWLSGQNDSLKNLKANATYTIEEGGRILS